MGERKYLGSDLVRKIIKVVENIYQRIKVT